MTGRGLLTVIPLPELLSYLGVVGPSNDADLHFPPQGLEKLIQLGLDFLQITEKMHCITFLHYMSFSRRFYPKRLTKSTLHIIALFTGIELS